jgi:hypothetical protein
MTGRGGISSPHLLLAGFHRPTNLKPNPTEDGMRKEDLPIEAKAELLEIAGGLSPENLTCDGELSSAEVDR